MLTKLAAYITKGKTIMAVYTYSMIALSAYSIIKKVPIDGSVAAMYSLAVAAFAGSKGYEMTEIRKQKLAAEKDPKDGYV